MPTDLTPAATGALGIATAMDTPVALTVNGAVDAAMGVPTDARVGPDRPAGLGGPVHQLSYDAHEFGRLERLGEKYVDANIEPGVDLVLSARADDGEGKIPGPGIGTEPGGGTQSVETGHHDIEGDDIGPYLVDYVQTFGTVSGGHDLDALQLEVDPDQLPDHLVVVHDKDPTGRTWHNSRVGRRPPPRPGFPDFHPLRVTRPSSGPRLPAETCSWHPLSSW